ncbi:hypothetical protein AgCh_024426 [Apium graveolens]
MASQITKPPFSTLRKPLIDVILHEHDLNLQTSSALCLATAIDVVPDPEPVELQKLLTKLLKLSKSDGFRGKSAILSLIGSLVSGGGAKSSNVLKCLIECLVEFLSNEDWTVRKAAVEALLKLAVTEKCSLFEYKSLCLVSLESRRFDKQKEVPAGSMPEGNDIGILDLDSGGGSFQSDEQQLDNVDSYSDKSADSKQTFSDGSTYPWDALPINELDDKDEQLLDDLDKYSDMDSEQSFSDGSTYSWDALPINELDVKQSSTV